jgi:predicted transcriptional regulator of viral defense system
LAKKPPDIFIANKLYQPSYLSFEYALSYYHIIPEVVYTVTSATVKPTREFEVLGHLFSYSKIQSKAFRGYVPKKIDNYTVLLAVPEKALADCLYFVVLKKTSLNERMDVSGLNRKLFLKYVKLFGNKKLVLLARKICFQKKR